MLLHGIAMAVVLNELAAGLTSAPLAEHALGASALAHHVADPEGLVGLDPLAAVPVRRFLARLDGRDAHVLLATAEPGHLSGLRGPQELTAAALDAGVCVITHDAWAGGAWLALVPAEVGPAVQWQVFAAERPVPPDPPREAARTLSRALLDAAAELAEAAPAGLSPFGVRAPRLGRAYPASSQTLLDRAWTTHAACAAGLAAQAAVLSSHEVLMRERTLRAMSRTSLAAIASAASWPVRTLEG